MENLGGGYRKWSQPAAAFLGLLKAGHLPAVTVSASTYFPRIYLMSDLFLLIDK